MKHLKTIMSVLIVLAAVSCTKHQTTGNGLVSFNLKNNLQITDVTRSSVSDHTTLPSAGNFTITINDASSAMVWSGKVSDWDAATQLPAGNYSVNASYGSLEDEGFDKPYFYGSQNFVVQGGQTSNVTVPVTVSPVFKVLSESSSSSSKFSIISLMVLYTSCISPDGVEAPAAMPIFV